MLGTKDNKPEELDIIETPATNRRGPYFELHQTKQRVTACDVATLSPFVQPKPPLYIPTHAACIQIAYQFASQDKKYGSGPDSLSHIWRVLKARFLASSTNRRIPLTKLPEPNAYYGELWKFHDMEWEPGEDPDLNYEAQVKEPPSSNNPLYLSLPMLTAEIALRSRPSPHSKHDRVNTITPATSPQ